MILYRWLWPVLASAVLVADATAQPQESATAAPKSIVAMPQSTTETYGDWVLICSNAQVGASCEIDSSLSLRGQAGAVARVAFGRSAKDKPLRLVVQTPSNVLIAPGVSVEAESDKKGTTLAYRMCAPGGCFAEADLSQDQNQAFRGRSTPGRLTFTDSTGRAIVVALSFRGLDRAFDALGRK